MKIPERVKEISRLIIKILGVVALIPILFMILIFLLGLGVTPFMMADCKYKTEAMKVESYFGFWEGCMVKYQDGYIPLSKIVVNQGN